MTIETEVAALTAATTSLTNEVIGQKTSLAASVELTAADVVIVNAAATSITGDAASAAISAADALVSANNAVAVVTGGTASIAPAAGKIPLADSKGHIDGGWLDTIPAVSQALPASLNIVDCCISLGKNDSDGRAWAKRTQHTSWYNEPRSTGAYINTAPNGYASAALAVAAGASVGDYYYNTATTQFEVITNAGVGTEASAVTYRAGSAEFPQDVAVTAEAGRLIIWDITGAQPTMWMDLHSSSNNLFLNANGLNSVAFKDGKLLFTSNNTHSTLRVIDFIKEEGDARTANTSFCKIFNGNISQRHDNTLGGYVSGRPPLASATGNDVAITVLPDAPIDSATGLPVPTIAVATAGGVSVIKDDGSMVNSGSTTSAQSMSAAGGAMTYYQGGFQQFIDLAGIATSFTPRNYYHTSIPPIALAWQSGAHAVLRRGRYALSGASGLFFFVENEGVTAKGAAAFITATSNTGYMVGDIRRCFLANSPTADRSVKGGALTMVGAVTETVNAGGRNVYSGFSAANYLQEASHADFNALGTGDFSIIMSGVKWGTAGTVRFMLSMGDGIGAGSLAVRLNGVNTLGVKIHNGTTFVGPIAESTATFIDTAEHVVEVKRGTFGGVANTLQILVDGAVVASTVSALTISNATGFLRIGERQDASAPWTGGQCACVRISATAPTAEQSKFIADQENKLNGGATCLLSSSNSVSALSCDADTDILHVGNGTNIDQFVGLQRVSSAASSAGTLAAIASGGGIKLEAGSTGGKFDAPAIPIKSELTAAHQQVAKAQQGTVTKMISSDAASVLTCPQGFKPIRITSAAGTYISLSTNAPTFDGFIWSINSGLAASTNYDVEMVRV